MKQISHAMANRFRLLALCLLLAAIVAIWGAPPTAAQAPELDAAQGGPGRAKPMVHNPGLYLFQATHIPLSTYPGLFVGEYLGLTWKDVETSPGVYNWAVYDAWVQAEAAGGKKVGLGIDSCRSGGAEVPAWVPVIHCDTTKGLRTIPDYWSATYQDGFRRLIQAFGQRYGDNVAVEWVQVSTGRDGENQPFSEETDQCLFDLGHDGDDWVATVNEINGYYRTAFPRKPLMTRPYPNFYRDSERRDIAGQAAALGIGFKGDGLTADRDKMSCRNSPASCGYGVPGRYSDKYLAYLEDSMLTYSDTLPIGYESYRGHYLQQDVWLYWALLNAMDSHADYVAFDQPLFRDTLGGTTVWPILRFANQHLGRHAGNTPSVWVAMRESGYTWYPKLGNYSFYLHQDDSVPGGKTTPLTYRARGTGAYQISNPAVEADQIWLGTAWESWITRRTDQASGNTSMYLNVDDRYVYGATHPISMTVTYFDRGTDSWGLEYDSVSGVKWWGGRDGYVQKHNTYQWLRKTIYLPDANFQNGLAGGKADFRISCNGDGDEIIHMVDLTHAAPLPPTETPTTEPATATPTSLFTETPTVTGTPPTATSIATPTATPTATPAPQIVTLRQGENGYTGGIDASISAYSPAVNDGNAANLHIKSDDVMRALLRFDVSAIPSDQVVTSAKLRLYVQGRDKSNPITLVAYRVLRAWEEAGATWTQAGVGQPWGTPGCDGIGSDRTGAITAVTTVDGVGVWAELDLTAMAAEWVAHPESNLGVLLTGSGPIATLYDWASTEYPLVGRRPQLEMAYLPPALTATPTATFTETPIPTPTETRTSTATATPTGDTATPTRTSTITPAISSTPTATPATGILRGRAWHDLNGNTAVDAGEPMLAGVEITLRDDHNVALSSLSTGEDGLYQFDELPAGSYVITAGFPAGYEPTTPSWWMVTIIANWSMTVDFGARLSATLTPTSIATATDTSTPTPTATHTHTATPTPSATITTASTPTATDTDVPTPTATDTVTPTPTASTTAAASATATATSTDSVIPSPSPTRFLPPTSTATATVWGTATPTPTALPRRGWLPLLYKG